MAPDEHLQHARSLLRSRYHVESEIGAGGAARVYLADPVVGGDPVAIKVLRDELAAAVTRERFRLEIAVAKTLHHPNILPVLDSGEVEDLLFYVAPFIRGETLRKRLQREHQLPLAEAIRIAGAIAAGLSEAHRQNIVHRDIKPENILLEGDRVVIADFGIARAITAAAGDRLTSTGIAIGTPGYMSPEQSSGNRDLDHRCDIYALGVVVYEMLAGERPFEGPTTQAIVAKQLSLPTPSLRTVRDAVPPAVDRAVHRALEKVPADRFDRVQDFAAALSSGAAGPSRWEWAYAPAARRTAWIGGGVAVAAAVWLLAGAPGVGTPVADTTRYLVLPVASASHPAVLHDALARWQGLTVIDGVRGEDARRLRAGRVLEARATPAGDSTRWSVRLSDAADSQLAESAFRVGPGGAHLDSMFALAVDSVLQSGGPPDSMTTRSFPAREGFLAGKRALERWDLPGADSSFAHALVHDPDYAQASLWLAVTRAWSGAAPARWRVTAQQAVLRKDRLSPGDGEVALAVVAEADSDWAGSCPQWRQATEREDRVFEVWYGLARCLVRDDAVIRDVRSRSGWRFRTSYDAALRAYESAFARAPGMLASFQPHSFEWLRFLYKTGGNQLRGGSAVAPDSQKFAADPEIRGDGVEFVPYPLGQERMRPASSNAAVRLLRVRFQAVATAWASGDPRSAQAHEALAIAMAMLGDPTAFDTLRRAIALADRPADRFRLATSEIWMRLGLSIPRDTNGILRVRQLADSLLEASPHDADPATLESLSALTGQVGRAAHYAVERHRAEAPNEPSELRDEGPAFLMYSALGGPAESLATFAPRVRQGIEALVPDLRAAARANWLILPTSIAFPHTQMAALQELAPEDPIIRLELEAMQGDSSSVRHELGELRELAKGVSPSAFTFDGLLPLASLELWAGSPQQAAAWLDPPLAALGVKAPDVLASPAAVACLVRAMALRAEIADQLHDHEGARRWAGVVVRLWSGADPYLRSMVTRQQHLAM